MTDSASETVNTAAKNEPAPFVEDDRAKTRLPYDRGGVPIYIALAWAAFIVTYIVVMSLVVLPDLRSWMAH
jgi:hypothetical protein